MLDQRKQKILAAVIEDYVLTAEPVGSKRLVERYHLGVSPATVRNELSILEEMGYLEQPHPSAGRVPSDLGYRYYVDSLVETTLPYKERESISTYYAETNLDIEELMRETSTLLSRLTSYASLVFAPAIRIDRLKHLDLILLSPRMVLMVIITSSGAVAKKVVEINENCDVDCLSRCETFINENLSGYTANEINRYEFVESVESKERKILNALHKHLLDLLIHHDSERIFLDGTVNLLSQPEFESLNRVQTLLSTLERSYKLLELLSEVAKEYSIVVKIGEENSPLEIEGCSLVASSYGIEGESLGALGILGPKRMNYSRSMATVQYIADNLSGLLESIHKRG